MVRCLPFDFGLKRIGVAVGNTFCAAEPLNIIHAPTNGEAVAEVAALIGNWQPVLCVVGTPSGWRLTLK